MSHYRPTIKQICDRYHIQPDLALHLGAREAAEHRQYDDANFYYVWWFEADPLKACRANAKITSNRHFIYPYAATDKDYEELKLLKCSDDAADSLFPLGPETKKLYPGHEITHHVPALGMTVDTVWKEDLKGQGNFTYIALDIQGAELLALRGMSKFLAHEPVNIMDIELDNSNEGFYANGNQRKEILDLLASYNFVQVASYPHYPGCTQADTIFVRK